MDWRISTFCRLPARGSSSWNGQWTEQYSEDLSDKEQTSHGFAQHGPQGRGYEKPARSYGAIIEDRGSQITFSALGQEAPLAEKEGWDPDRTEAPEDRGRPQSQAPCFDIRIGGTTSVDITRRGVNKAYGIHKLEERLKIPIDKIVFVGDELMYGGNDFPAKSTGVDCIQVAGAKREEASERVVSLEVSLS